MRPKTRFPRKDKALLMEWAEKYAMPVSVLRKYNTEEWAQLVRMEEHARATIFSSLKWEKERARRMRYNSVNVKRTVPLVTAPKGPKPQELRLVKQEPVSRVDRLIALAFGMRAA